MRVTIYRYQIQANKETQDVLSFQTDLFQKVSDQKSSNKA